ncbi:uncharacterized protein BT62DRAFT_935682 [Guyanagaster necrorhizus]|uniref:Uncharacterized protein n=1 Tax=Guyanagaster necrorhizus TaxID=856835 RepID=A0A9P7VLG7_9AGAR|nr:uncharacterized protein BT62DRAFT_935682 [Guyanagaster necrorhizus MCA 3950]KAG7442662.1 hypothetical protein BT62DRAFT_935682 [Guyanagaster necrorhizus MCA 3950]
MIPIEILSCAGLQSILQSRSFGNLWTLEISYRLESSDAKEALLHLIPRVSPELRCLELNRYIGKGIEEDVDISVRHQLF